MSLNFFDISKDLVNTLASINNEPDWLLKRRIKGFNSYINAPAEKSPLYAKYSTLNKTNFQDIDLNDYNLPVSNDKIPEDFKYILDDNNENFTIFQIDGKLVDTFDHYSKEKLILTNINNAIQKHPKLIQEYLTKNILSADEDKFVALNNCMFNSGIFLYIPFEKQKISIAELLPLVALLLVDLKNNLESSSDEKFIIDLTSILYL